MLKPEGKHWILQICLYMLGGGCEVLIVYWSTADMIDQLISC